MKNMLKTKIKGISRRTLCGILSAVIVLSSVSVGLVISASDNYISMPSLPEYHVMPMAMSEDSSLFSKFDNAERYFYNQSTSSSIKPTDVFETQKRKPGKTGLAALTLSTRGAGIHKMCVNLGTSNIVPVLRSSGSNYGLLDITQLQSRMFGYGSMRTVKSYHENYPEFSKYTGHRDSGWSEKYGGAKLSVDTFAEISDFMVIARDAVMPVRSYASMNLKNDVPVFHLSFSESLRVCAPKTVNSEVLETMKLRIVLVPRKDQGATPIAVTARATELGSQAITFEIDDAEENKALYKEISKDENHKGHGFIASDEAAGIEWVGYEELLNEEWMVLYVSDISEYGSYPLQTTAGIIEGYNVTLPITDYVGNQISLPGNWDLRSRNVTLDAVNPYATLVQMSGTSIKAESDKANLEEDKWPEDIERADLFSGIGDTVDADIVMSETVRLGQGSLGDVKIEWSINDADGNPITTSLKSIEGHRETVNSNVVSKLNFESFTITEDMQFNGTQIKPLRIINCSYIYDGSNNKMKADTETEKFFEPVISHQSFLDIKGPTVEIVEGGVFKVNDSAYTPASSDEVYYIIGLDISDSKVTGAGDAVIYGSGITADLPSFVGLTSYDGAPNVSYQYTMSKTPDYITGNLPVTGTIGAGESETEFTVPAEGVFYMHLKMYPENGTEISDEQGITAAFRLKDAKGNESNIGVPIVELGLDKKSPVITNLAVKDLETLTVTASVEDTNKISRFEYQWVEPDAQPAANGWTMLDLTDKEPCAPSVDISYDENVGDTYFDKVLYIRAYDGKENGISGNIRVAADFEKRIPVYTVNGRIDVPSAVHSITVHAPYTKQTNTKGGYTRATVVSGDKTYVRVINLADGETAELFDVSAQWYEVTVADGKYTSVSSVTPAFDHYGCITVDFAASSADLTPVQGAEVTPSGDSHFSVTEGVTIANAPAKDGVHSVELGGVYAADGTEMAATTAGGYTYYEVSNTLTGIRYQFTLNNAIIPEWERANVDFANSYAVLLKTDANGALDTAEEISERYSLGSSSNQSVILSDKDKNGNIYETGAYILKVFVAQKDGGTQEFILGEYIVLDNSELPEVFGVREYSRTVAATYQDSYNGPLVETVTAEEGQVLDTINISVAKPDNYAHIADLEVVEKDGNPAYVLEHQNALPDGTSYPLSISTDIVAQYDSVNILGKDIGKVKGIRYWNKAQTGDYTALEYTVNYAYENQAELYISNYLGWYTEDHMGSFVVSAEELAQTDVSDFKVAIGSNTVCYQLVMENGKESPVYTYELNLFDHQIEMELEYEFGPAIEREYRGYGYDENDEYYEYTTTKKTAQYVDVYVTNAYSPIGGLKLYHSKYDDYYNNWEHTEITDTANPIRLTLSSDGYEGSDSTRTDITGTPECWEFITLVDSVGTAVTAYPILSDVDNTAENLYPYGINPEIGTMTVNYYDESASTVGADDRVAHNFVFNVNSGASIGDIVDSITVQVDDRGPVNLNADINSDENDFVDGANNAGIVSFKRGYFSVGDIAYTYRDMVELVFPYDPTLENGAEVNHTVTICGYLDGEEVYARTFNITAENTAPSLELYAPYFGKNRVYANTYLNETPDASNSYYAYATDVSETFYADGEYTVEVYDKYGVKYDLPIIVSGLPADPVVTFSETEPTTKPVTITVASASGTLDYDGLPEGWSAEGKGTSKLVITATSNTDSNGFYVDCTYDEDNYESVGIYVDNIYPSEIIPKVEWQYNKYKVNAEDNTYEGEITAILVDENGTEVIDPKTGVAPKYVFVPDGVTEYTFSGYTNIAGATGPDITAVLPVTLKAYETTTTASDEYSPDIAITGFATYGGSTQNIQAVFTKSDSTRPEEAGVIMPDYSISYGEKVYGDIDLLLREIGWADSYVLDVDVLDENAVKLFVTQDIHAAVPDYSSGKSDVIDGVSLIGRTLEISKNTTFALHAVDKEGNVTSVQFNVTTLGSEAPEPNIVQVLTKTGDEVRVYVLPPNIEGVTNLTVTSDGVQTETDTTSIFYGYQYMSYKDNQKVIIGYSYDHGGTTHKGNIELDIVQIDNSVPSVDEMKWSANYDEYGQRLTNQDISVQMDLNKALSDIYPVDSDGSRILAPDGVTVTYLEDRVTVVFEQNAPEMTLKAISAVNKTLVGYIELPAIKTIDKIPAEVTASVEYAQNRRNAVITFNASEDVILQYSGKKGTQFTEKVTAEGTFTYNFADLAGSVTEVKVEIADLITEELTLVLATEKSEASIIDPETYDVDIGDVLYAKTNRNATLTVNGESAQTAAANVWTAVEIKEDSEGIYPIVKAQDDYGYAAIVQLLRIPVKDRTPPSVIVKKNLISTSIDSTDDEIKALLAENIMVTDDVTPSDKLTVNYDYNIGSMGGKYLVTCTVADENGNETVKSFWLRVYDGKEMKITVNGETVERDETVVVSTGEQEISLSFTGEPYKVVYKPGIKSIGQMKTGSTPVTQGYTDAKENTFTLDFSESGYYSFLVTTQSNETYRFVLYAE
ncbi:MAG: hypothetical protein IJE19_01510 [Clostridia bacterium]|nr:hypothetical protein [Clostridia bacterium]